MPWIWSVTVLGNSSQSVKPWCSRVRPGRSAAMISLRPSRSVRSTASLSKIGAISSSGAYSPFERIAITRPPADHACGLGRRRDGVGNQLQHPDEVGGVDAVVGERQPVDIGEGHGWSEPSDGETHHRLAQVETGDVDAVASQAGRTITPVPTANSTTVEPTIHGARSSAKLLPRRSPPRVSS